MGGYDHIVQDFKMILHLWQMWSFFFCFLLKRIDTIFCNDQWHDNGDLKVKGLDINQKLGAGLK